MSSLNKNERALLIGKNSRLPRLSFSILIGILLLTTLILYIKVFFAKQFSVLLENSLSNNLKFKRLSTVQEFRLLTVHQVQYVRKNLKFIDDG
jgi:hypothetical protein